ncbi:MAG: Mur ligase family protein [Cyclobacteriaceae bacterium]|jgi:UDP-N-acetylmuramate: L-alanyl-gamma-D-glutamyl-meso-diaminopimelate ligase|nr:Mur ligase domain-containing protein [Flammeovirgaceae bacterium]MCZ8020253.1 Mur ligase family protein [Cytophagales bacterium]MCZ8327099.1 Mur ligase family protein [Cyclobacteriaceae bacterium]
MGVKHQKIHFIAIGGSVMHNLAIALKQQGHTITGSDDEIFEPSKSLLQINGLLPAKEGWNADVLDTSYDAVILGMHAKADNPELLKAKSLGLKINSFPDFIFEHSRDKQRVVIAGSHGKTTITAIIMHVLNFHKKDFDFVVGAKVNGLPLSVKLSDAPIIVIEGDEYLSSAEDRTPKFLKYQHHIGVISGISWDHANVFPTEDVYVKQFDLFADQTPKGGILIYNEQDNMTLMIAKKERADVLPVPYKTHPHSEEGQQVFLTNGKERYPIQLFGTHNLQNISAAKETLKKIGINAEMFFQAIGSFEGASGRLQKVKETETAALYKDFAHAPSKVKATVKAMKEMFPSRDLVACLELHTYSSLNESYLPNYKDSLKQAQTAIVYFEPSKVAAKGFPELTQEKIHAHFGSQAIQVFTDSESLLKFLKGISFRNKNLLMMSSGNFGGLSLPDLF